MAKKIVKKCEEQQVDKPRAEKVRIPIGSIIECHRNIRRAMDRKKLDELKNSIEKFGQLQPIVVNQRNGTDQYELVFGHRRLEAHRELGLKTIDANVYSGLARETIIEWQWTENLAREDVNPIDEAIGFQAMLDLGKTVDFIAARIDKSEDMVKERLELLRLDGDIQTLVAAGRLPLKHARIISRVGSEQQKPLVCRCLDGQYWKLNKKEWGEFLIKRLAEPCDVLMHIRELRREVSNLLRNLGAKDCEWPLDEDFAGRPPCVGCLHNSASQPELFEGLRLEGKSKRGNCSNAECFNKKFKVWFKDPRKKALEKKREEARNQRAIKAAKDSADMDDGMPTATSAKERPFPQTPESKLAVAQFQWGENLTKRMVAHARKNADNAGLTGMLIVVAEILNHLDMGTTWGITISAVAAKKYLANPIANEDCIRSLACDLFESALEELPDAPRACESSGDVYEVPLPDDTVSYFDLLTVIAKEMGIEDLPAMPTETETAADKMAAEEFDAAKPKKKTWKAAKKK